MDFVRRSNCYGCQLRAARPVGGRAPSSCAPDRLAQQQQQLLLSPSSIETLAAPRQTVASAAGRKRLAGRNLVSCGPREQDASRTFFSASGAHEIGEGAANRPEQRYDDDDDDANKRRLLRLTRFMRRDDS